MLYNVFIWFLAWNLNFIPFTKSVTAVVEINQLYKPQPSYFTYCKICQILSSQWKWPKLFHTLEPWINGRWFKDDICKCICYYRPSWTSVCSGVTGDVSASSIIWNNAALFYWRRHSSVGLRSPVCTTHTKRWNCPSFAHWIWKIKQQRNECARFVILLYGIERNLIESLKECISYMYSGKTLWLYCFI